MDPKERHELDQVTGAIRSLAYQTAVFYRALLEEGLGEREALSLSGDLLATTLTMGQERRDAEDD